jgi:DNA invertase Pin-like site-specific DNA recombinase
MRVSRVGDRSKTLISPKLQEEAIRRSIAGRDIELEMLPAELDQSGGKDERPILRGGIERIKLGQLDGIVVWNFARFTRSLSSSLAFLEEIEGAGGQLLSASQPVDPKTSSGRMSRNIFFSIAQAEREEMAEGFERAKADAIARGVWTAPHVPFGFRKNEGRCLEPHPTEAPVRREVIRMRAAGDTTWLALQTYIREKTGRNLTLSTVRSLVRSRVSLGEVRQGEHVNTEAHPAIVDRATFEAAQLEQPKPPRGDHGKALLAGIVRCAGCSRVASPRFRGGHRYYSCRRHHSTGECPAPANANAELEEYVVRSLFIYARRLSYTATERTGAIEAAQEALEEAEAELALYQETVRLSDVGAEHFEAGMRIRVAAVEDARRALAAARLASPRVLPGTLEEIWPQLSVGERRQVLRSSFSVIWLRRGSDPIENRVRLIADGHEPAALSGSGRSAGPLVTIDWPDGDLEGEVRVASMENGRKATGGATL